MTIYKRQDKPYDSICSLSGGLDTTVLAYQLKRDSKNPLCVFISYGQKSKKRERALAKRTSKKLGLDLALISLPFYKGLSDSYLLGGDTKEEGKEFWLEGRNPLFALILSILASKYKVAEVYLGNHGRQEGFEQYPDTSISTEQAINSLIDVSFVNKVKVIDPFIELSKADLVKLGVRLKVPFRDTFSCCEGEKQPCGKCEACNKRAEAFKEAKVEDK